MNALNSDLGDLRQAINAYYAGKPEATIDVIRAFADSGEHKAEFVLGEAYSDGRGVVQNKELSLYWYERSYKRGNAQAAIYLAFHYEEINERALSNRYYAVALERFRQEAKSNDGEAMRWLAMCYMNGWGVARDYDKMYQWLVAASAAGCKLATAELTEIHNNPESKWHKKSC